MVAFPFGRPPSPPSKPAPKEEQIPAILVFGDPKEKRRVLSLLESIYPSPWKDFTVVEMPHLEDEYWELKHDHVLKFYEKIVGCKHGVSLLVHCVGEDEKTNHGRARFLENPERNQRQWNLCFAIMCRKSVPVVLVVQGLNEHLTGTQWWSTPEVADSLRRYRMHPHGVCYLGDSRGGYTDPQSQELRKVISRVRGSPWKVERTRWVLKLRSETRPMDGVKALRELCGLEEDDAKTLGADLEDIA